MKMISMILCKLHPLNSRISHNLNYASVTSILRVSYLLHNSYMELNAEIIPS